MLMALSIMVFAPTISDATTTSSPVVVKRDEDLIAATLVAKASEQTATGTTSNTQAHVLDEEPLPDSTSASVASKKTQQGRDLIFV